MIRTTTIPNSWFILKIWRTLHNIPIPKMPSAASPSDVRRTHQGQLVCKEQWWRQRNTQRRSHRIPRKSSMASTSQPQGSQKLDHWRLFQTGKAVTYSFEHHSTIFNFMLGMCNSHFFWCLNPSDLHLLGILLAWHSASIKPSRLHKSRSAGAEVQQDIASHAVPEAEISRLKINSLGYCKTAQGHSRPKLT